MYLIFTKQRFIPKHQDNSRPIGFTLMVPAFSFLLKSIVITFQYQFSNKFQTLSTAYRKIFLFVNILEKLSIFPLKVILILCTYLLFTFYLSKVNFNCSFIYTNQNSRKCCLSADSVCILYLKIRSDIPLPKPFKKMPSRIYSSSNSKIKYFAIGLTH